MIGAFFAILKIVGLLILLILGILLLLILLALFWSFKYSTNVKYTNKELEYDIEVSWLAKLISFYTLKNSEGEKTLFRIAWLKIINKETDADEVPDEKNKEITEIKDISEEKKEDRTQSKKVSETSSKTETIKKESETINESAEEDKDSAEKKSRLKDLFAQAKEIYNYPNKDEIFREVIALIKRLLRALKPKYLYLDCEFGFETPDTTGLALAIAGIIRSIIYKDSFNIEFKGNFNEKILNINTGLNGKIALWSGLWPLLAFIFKKPIWKIISAKLFNKNNSEGND